MQTYIVKTKKNYLPDEGRIYFEPSLTIPDQTMSIRTILEKYGQGQPITGNASEPLYLGEDPIVDFKNLDLADQEDYIQLKKDELKSIKKHHSDKAIEENAKLNEANVAQQMKNKAMTKQSEVEEQVQDAKP